MITKQESLLAILDAANYVYQLYEHPPVFTVEQAMHYCKDIPGAHVKNLFLRNKKKTSYLLVTVKDEKTVDLLALGETLGIGRLSFASGDDLIKMLNVQPGSVTPLAMMNDQDHRVKLYFDHDLLNDEFISIHPMVNTATLCLKLSDLILLIEKNHREKIEFIEIP